MKKIDWSLKFKAVQVPKSAKWSKFLHLSSFVMKKAVQSSLKRCQNWPLTPTTSTATQIAMTTTTTATTTKTTTPTTTAATAMTTMTATMAMKTQLRHHLVQSLQLR